MRIFLDANILFSATNPSGSIRQLLKIARAAGHQCWADEHVIREAHRNLFLKQRERISDFSDAGEADFRNASYKCIDGVLLTKVKRIGNAHIPRAIEMHSSAGPN